MCTSHAHPNSPALTSDSRVRRSTARSANLLAAARQVIPGGVSSPVRAFRSVGGTPPFIIGGKGARITDADGNTYLDFVLSWGALALGHAHPLVVEAITLQAERGTSFGAPTELETELAEMVVRAMPAVEMLRFVSSGTEAVMSAIRLSRAATGRRKIVKFAGCYHGHADSLLVQAGSGVATLGLPDSPGVTAGAVADTLTASYNSIDEVEALLSLHPGAVAAIIVEPVAGNMGLVLPSLGFLQGLRRLTTAHGALLIFDEVMTGFRVAFGGAQRLYNISPDLTCLGKIMGGGLPAAAYGGRLDLMEQIAPSGKVYQAGTLSGNPLAMAAGIATLRELGKPGAYESLDRASLAMANCVRDACLQADLPVQTNALGGMWGFFLTDTTVTDFASAKTADTRLYARVFHALLDEGIYLAPSQFEAAFVSTAHDAQALEAAHIAVTKAVMTVRNRGAD
ncbi:MAG: glutamate-1-semialdehyde 2,1-aminomutase [Anaerolineae bacterium]|nr:glutamate-1-semialdehyde 2,1-aminomutase [Gemmatimonadaceae bacterium]